MTERSATTGAGRAPADSEPRQPPRTTEAAGTPVVVDAELDCRDLLCPLPVYQAAAAMAKLGPGQVLRIECTDRGSLEDFPAFCRQRGHTLVSAEDRGETQVFLIRKGGAA
jgi:tRNA 2-thiouridine synthesizing protein A